MSPPFDLIEKPTLLLDEATARRNIRRMVQRVKQAAHQPLRFRPHFKTHQSAEIGEWFREEGITAITVSSLDMAIYFAQHGWEDITIAFPANLRQGKALSGLAQRIRLGLLLESTETVARLASLLESTVDIWIKIDVGAHRTGLPWTAAEQVHEVALAAQAETNLRLRGLLTHAGQIYSARSVDEVCDRYSESVDRLYELRLELAERGLDGLELSVGDTPGATLVPDLGPVDEIRPGNFVFYDAQQMQIGSCGWEDVAVALACPVVATHPARSEIVVYGGAVHFSKDFLVEDGQRIYGYACLPEAEGWGPPLPGAYMVGMSQEHGIIRMQSADIEKIRVGDLVCVLPAHSCLAVTLMKRYLTLTGRAVYTMNI
jgi:D-serine deaminase-like pyridoxal phosphate-dependent protein